MDGELEPQASPRQLRAKQEAKIADLKNRSLEIAFEAQAAEFERRLATGQLAEDLKGMKTGALLGNLTRMAAAIKAAAVIITPSSAPMRDPTALKAQSATQLSQAQRELRRKNAEAIDAEVVEPE